MLGQLYDQQGKSDQAIKSFRDVSKSSPKYPEANLSLGQIYLKSGDAYNAKKTFDMIVKNYPGSSYSQSAKLFLKSME